MATVTSTTTGFFPTAKEGFITTTSSTTSSGAATVGLNTVAGYSDGEYVTLVIEPTGGTSKQVFTGRINVAGTNVTGVTWTEGTNIVHNAGVTVVDYETATAWALQRKGILVGHNEDGTHKTTSVATALTPSGVTTTMIADNAVTASKLDTAAITLGYAQVTSNVSVTSTTDTQVTGLSSTVTVPAGGRRIKITVYAGNITETNASTIGIKIWDGAVGTGTTIAFNQQSFVAGITSLAATLLASVVPSAGSKTYNVSISASVGTVTLNNSTSAPSFILIEAI